MPPPADFSRILVRAANWLGDAVMSLPALRALRERFPRAHIAVQARPWVADLYAREHFLDRIIPYAVARGAADWGGKIKTIIQMTSLGCLLGRPMFALDIAPLCPFSISWWVTFVQWTGIVLFFVAMWFMISSMWSYYRKYRHVLFDGPEA